MQSTGSAGRSANEQLPYIDEHSTDVTASAELTWDALLDVVEHAFGRGRSGGIARLLGCADANASGPRPLAAGSAFPGFHVDAADRPSELALGGSHRFSEYALIFRLESLAAGPTRLRAESRASFPGVKGAAYRALVIGSRGHVLVTRRLLDAVGRRAERASAARN